MTLTLAVTLNLPKIHAERRMMLLRHRDRSARALHTHLPERLEHGGTVGAACFFDGRLVGVNRLVFRHDRSFGVFNALPNFFAIAARKSLFAAASIPVT